MGARGPAPARSDQRRRRNKPDTPTEQVEVHGEVVPPKPNPKWAKLVKDWYQSLSTSGQHRYFEPSDWQTAVFCAELMDRAVKEAVNAQLIAQIRGLMGDLLTTEGARRRVGVELVRKLEGEGSSSAPNVARLDERRKRVADADAS